MTLQKPHRIRPVPPLCPTAEPNGRTREYVAQFRARSLPALSLLTCPESTLSKLKVIPSSPASSNREDISGVSNCPLVTSATRRPCRLGRGNQLDQLRVKQRFSKTNQCHPICARRFFRESTQTDPSTYHGLSRPSGVPRTVTTTKITFGRHLNIRNNRIPCHPVRQVNLLFQ